MNFINHKLFYTVFTIVLVFVITFLSTNAHAQKASKRPSCNLLKTSFNLRFEGSLDTTEGKAKFSKCWKKGKKSTAAVVVIKGQAPQKLLVFLSPDGNSGDFYLDARDATNKDLQKAKSLSKK